MPTMLEVEPEIASKIQARARERGVPVDVYLKELFVTRDSSAIRTSPGFKGLNEILVLHALMTNYARLLATLLQVGHQSISQPAVRPGEHFQSIYGVVMKGDSLGDYLLTVRRLRHFV
jgi:hypothetical protein